MSPVSRSHLELCLEAHWEGSGLPAAIGRSAPKSCWF